MTLQLTLFGIGLFVVIYLLNSLFARKFKKIVIKTALLYISSVAMMGVFGEVFVGNIYNAIFNHHLWDYTVLPVQGGFTSMYAPVIWGAYGFYLYLSHDTLKKYGITRHTHLALIFAVETVLLEAATNGSFRVLFGEYLFYYTPGDLWHLTSIRAIPFYLLAGFAIARIVDRYQRATRLNIVMNSYLIFVMVFLAR